MSKHTPGPWQRGGLHVSAFLITPQGSETHPIADVYDEVNARLIAAAPELLAACEAVENPNMTMAQTLALLHVAIAKAKGETL